MMKRIAVLALFAFGAATVYAADTTADRQTLEANTSKVKSAAKAQPCPCAGAHR